MNIEEIRKGAPKGADHYMKLFGKIKYLKKTKTPTLLTHVVQFLFRIKPLT